MVRTKAVAIKKEVDEPQQHDAEEGVVTTATARHRRNHAGTVALREIRRYQRSTEPLIQRAPFLRLVRQLLQAQNPDMRMQTNATIAVQEAAEAFLAGIFEDANLVAIHSHHTTISDKDIKLVSYLRGRRHDSTGH